MTLAALRQVVEGDPRDWRTVAQVAVEAVVNDPSAYDPATRRLVAEVGRKAGVARMYLDLLPADDRTADGGRIRIGEVYWDYDHEQSRVLRVSHDETHDDGTVVRWYVCERVHDGSRKVFDGSRLAVRRPW